MCRCHLHLYGLGKVEYKDQNVLKNIIPDSLVVPNDMLYEVFVEKAMADLLSVGNSPKEIWIRRPRVVGGHLSEGESNHPYGCPAGEN